MKKFKRIYVKRLVVLGLTIVLVMSMCLVSSAKSKTGSFTCSGYYVGCELTKTSSKATAKTGFTDTLTGQKTSATINSVIQIDNGTGKTKSGTPQYSTGGKTASVTYGCPSGYSIVTITTRHTAQVNGATKTETYSLQ